MSYTMKPSQYLALLLIERERGNAAPLYERDMDRLMHPVPSPEPLSYIKIWGYAAPRSDALGRPMSGTLTTTKDGQRALCAQVVSCESQIMDLVRQCQANREKFANSKGVATSIKEYERQERKWLDLRDRIDELREEVLSSMPMDGEMKAILAASMASLMALRQEEMGPRVVPNAVYVDGAKGSDSNDGATWETAKQTIQAAKESAPVVAKRKPGRPRKVAVEAEPKALR